LLSSRSSEFILSGTSIPFLINIFANLNICIISRKITLLLDEPEKALSIPKQIELFDVLIKLSEHFQIIMATHSPFILEYKKANLIDFTPGYAAECRKLIKNIGKGK